MRARAIWDVEMFGVKKDIGIVDHFLERKRIHCFVVFLAIVSAAIMGIETFQGVSEMLKHRLGMVHHGITAFFTLEMILKIVVLGARRFFRNGWHLFDFIVVSISFVGMGSSLEVVGALRSMRLFALLDFIPKMHGIARAIHHSMPGIIGTALVAVVFFYVSALLAHGFFGEKCPSFFGDLAVSLLTLLKVATLDGWYNDVLLPVSKFYSYAWVFFVVFIIVVGFVILNLFIGVIVDAVSESYDEGCDAGQDVQTRKASKSVRMKV